MRTLLDWLNPAAVVDGFDMMRKPDPVSIPDPPGRPDMADVIDHDNNAINEINESVLDAEINGGLPPMAYPLSLEQIKEGHQAAERR